MSPVADSGVPELDPGLGNVLFDVWLVSRAATAAIDAAVRPTGLDADEFAVYSVLASGDGMTPTELAHWMAAPPTTVSSYVKRFTDRGHVERVPNPDDRRSYRLRLTDAGRAAHLAAGELFAPLLAEVVDRLGRGADDTHRRLRTLRSALQPVEGSASRSTAEGGTARSGA